MYSIWKLCRYDISTSIRYILIKFIREGAMHSKAVLKSVDAFHTKLKVQEITPSRWATVKYFSLTNQEVNSIVVFCLRSFYA